MLLIVHHVRRITVSHAHPNRRASQCLAKPIFSRLIRERPRRGVSLFDASGRLLFSAQREFSQSYPQPGWVEHDPQTIWRDVLHTAREVIAKANSPVAAIGIANQRETTVVWERADGTPIYPAIVWQDRRTAAECERLRQEGAETLVRGRTGLLLDPYFSATKLAWILGHVAGARARAERGELAFGTIDSFLLWHLTGGKAHATDATNASRTMLFDIHRQCGTAIF